MRNKRYYFLSVLLLLMVLFVLPVQSVKAEEKDGFWTYDVKSDESDQKYAVITGYSGAESDIRVPEKLGGYPVKWLSAKFNEYTESVTFPAGIEEIASSVFENCSSLTTVKAPGVTTIGWRAFKNCTALTTVSTPKVKEIEFEAFYNCTALSQFDYFEQLKVMRYDAFRNSGLTGTITIGGEIGNCAFAGCTNLTGIVIKDGADIGSSIVKDTNVMSAIVGDNVRTGSSFANCKTLKHVEMGKNKNSGRHYSTFLGCSSLAFVKLPSDITRIETNMFKNCSSLTSIQLPDSVEDIGYNAFYGSGLTSIALPKRLLRIGKCAFQNTQITNLTLPDRLISVERWSLPSTLVSLTIPNSVTDIDGNAVWMGAPGVSCYEGSCGERYATEQGFEITYLSAVPATSISLPNSISEEVGKPIQLSAEVSPANSTDAVVWSSMDTNIAEVDGNGVVRTKRIGTVAIVAQTTSGQKAVCSITVKNGPDRIALNTDACQLLVGATKTVKATVYAGDTVYKNMDVTYYSDNEKIAKVSPSGKITAVAQGSTSIYAKFTDHFGKEHSASCRVTVVPLSKPNCQVHNEAGYVNVQWSSVGEGATYKVYRKAKGGKWNLIKTTKALKYKDTAVKSKNGTMYFYAVSASLGKTSSGKGTTQQVFRLNAPKFTKLSKAPSYNRGMTQMTAVWKPVSKATGYEIQYDTKKDFSSYNKYANKVTNAKPYKFSCINGKTIYVRVRAYKEVNGWRYYSSWSTVKKISF